MGQQWDESRQFGPDDASCAVEKIAWTRYIGASFPIGRENGLYSQHEREEKHRLGKGIIAGIYMLQKCSDQGVLNAGHGSQAATATATATERDSSDQHAPQTSGICDEKCLFDATSRVFRGVVTKATGRRNRTSQEE